MATRTPPKRQVNPFAFPVETDVRFVLLILTTVALSINSVGATLLAVLTLVRPAQTAQEFLDTSQRLGTMMSPQVPEGILEDPSLSRILGFLLRSLIEPGLAALFLLAALGVAYAIYRRHPAQVRRRRGLEAFPPGADASFHKAFERMASEAGVRPLPEVQLSKGLKVADGQAFGFPKRYAVGFLGGVRLLFRKRPSAFRAMVLHELAHITNRDIGRTYFSRALRYPLVLLALGPVPIAALVLLVRFVTFESLGLWLLQALVALLYLFQAAATFAVAWLVLASVLRVREVYADWRVSVWGAKESLAGLLRGLAARAKKRRFEFLRFHPTAQERLSALEQPDKLFRVSRGLPLLVGILVGFLAPPLVSLVDDLSIPAIVVVMALALALHHGTQTDSHNLLVIGLRFVVLLVIILTTFVGDIINVGWIFLPGFLLSYLVMGTVGRQVQREALYDMVHGSGGLLRYVRLGGTALLITLGFEIGAEIGFMSSYSPLNVFLAEYLGRAWMVVLLIPWLVGFALATWLGLACARFGSKRLLGTVAGASPPKRRMRVLTYGTSGLLCLFYAPLLMLRWWILSQKISIPGTQAVIIGLVAGLLLAPPAIGVMWLLGQIRPTRKPLACPACGTVAGASSDGALQARPTTGAPNDKWTQYAVLRSCQRCGESLSPWLFVGAAEPAQADLSGSEQT